MVQAAFLPDELLFDLIPAFSLEPAKQCRRHVYQRPLVHIAELEKMDPALVKGMGGTGNRNFFFSGHAPVGGCFAALSEMCGGLPDIGPDKGPEKVFEFLRINLLRLF